jgi:hypothetical protein
MHGEHVCVHYFTAHNKFFFFLNLKVETLVSPRCINYVEKSSSVRRKLYNMAAHMTNNENRTTWQHTWLTKYMLFSKINKYMLHNLAEENSNELLASVISIPSQVSNSNFPANDYQQSLHRSKYMLNFLTMRSSEAHHVISLNGLCNKITKMFLISLSEHFFVCAPCVLS